MKRKDYVIVGICILGSFISSYLFCFLLIQRSGINNIKEGSIIINSALFNDDKSSANETINKLNDNDGSNTVLEKGSDNKEISPNNSTSDTSITKKNSDSGGINNNDKTTISGTNDTAGTVKSNTSETNNTVGYTTSSNTTGETTLTLKEQNEALIAKIYKTYGYRVSYNAESFYYNGQECTQLTDEEKANSALNALYKKSAMFPSGFFRVFQGYNGYRVILYDDIPNAAGVASYEFGDDNKLALNVSTDFLGRTFFHETFHIVDQYIYYKTYGESNPFDDWSRYNPTEFKYGSSGTKYTIYDFDSPHNDITFVSEYAKTNPREDRAELFADLMFRPYKKPYMDAEYGVNTKAKNLALILRRYFPNATGSAWENWITW